MTEIPLFHQGEIAVQTRAGVADRAARSGAHSIRNHLIEQHQDFYPLLPMVFAGYLDAEGRPWASVLTGTPGFSSAVGDKRLRIDAVAAPGDPIADVMSEGLAIGLLGLEWGTRRRNRMNGIVRDVDAGGFAVDVIHAFGNCPKYIQTRQAVGPTASGVGPAEFRNTLNAADRTLISRADTFFIATAASGGSDVSHRGGKTGFLRPDARGALIWPDYSGNNFFQTLGNIETNPIAGLLIPDWESGAVLQMTGQAEIRWDQASRASMPGAKRVVAFTPQDILMTRGVLPDRWEVIEMSPFLDRLKD